MTASYHRNPFGISENDPDFDERLAAAHGLKVGARCNISDARAWLEQWQEENPIAVTKPIAPEKPKKPIKILWDQVYETSKKLFDGQYKLLLAYAAGDAKGVRKCGSLNFTEPFGELIESLNLDLLKDGFSTLPIEEKTTFLLAAEVYKKASNVFYILADMLEGEDLSVEKRSEVYSWLSNLLALTIEARKLVP